METDEMHGALVEIAKARSLCSPWMSIQNLAKHIGVSIRTVRRIHAAGGGPARVKRSRKLMYRRDDVESWLAAQKAQTK